MISRRKRAAWSGGISSSANAAMPSAVMVRREVTMIRVVGARCGEAAPPAHRPSRCRGPAGRVCRRGSAVGDGSRLLWPGGGRSRRSSGRYGPSPPAARAASRTCPAGRGSADRRASRRRLERVREVHGERGLADPAWPPIALIAAWPPPQHRQQLVLLLAAVLEVAEVGAHPQRVNDRGAGRLVAHPARSHAPARARRHRADGRALAASRSRCGRRRAASAGPRRRAPDRRRPPRPP